MEGDPKSSKNGFSRGRKPSATASDGPVPPNVINDIIRALMECGCHYKGGRNLVICIDGTSNKFGKKNTNVVELYHLIIKTEGSNQYTWYHSGIGTYAKPSWKSWNYVKQVIDHKVDLAIAWNFERTVMGAYRWLSDKYMEGDNIFLFGFSRGAFQVRVLSAMIEKVGLIFPGNEMQIPFAYELYADPDSDSMAKHFKETFCRQNVKVHFVGAWDTVSSIGIARGKKLLPGTIDGMKHVCYFRHALALDERRVKFLPEFAFGGTASESEGERVTSYDHEESYTDKIHMTQDSKSALPPQKPEGSTRKRPHTKEVWFAGTHSDIGGGNVQNLTMDRSRPPLRWMVFEAALAGLRTFGFKGELSSNELIEIRESLTWLWWPLEVLPLSRLTFTRDVNGSVNTHRPHLGASRKIHPGQKIHASLVMAKRSDLNRYSPKARPPEDASDFWSSLETNPLRKWLEFDIYDEIDAAVDEFLAHSVPRPKGLYQVPDSGAGRQALYEKLIVTLTKDDVDRDAKYQLLEMTMDIFGNSTSGESFLRLEKSVAIRPYMEQLTQAEEYNKQTVGKFMSNFTERCIAIMEGHSGRVHSVSFSNDGQRVVSGSTDRTIRFWNVKTGEAESPVLQGHTGDVNSVAFAPDGNRIVSGSTDETIRIWDVNTGKQIGKPLEGHKGWVWSVAFSPDGSRIASGSSDGTVRLWDAATGEAIGSPMEGHYETVCCVAFSPDGKHVASGSYDRTIRLWDARTGQPVREPFRGHTDSVTSAVFSPDGKYLASGSWDTTIRLWDLKTGKQDGRAFEGHGAFVWSIAFLPDGRRIVSGSVDTTVRLWNVKTREEEGPPLGGHTNWVWSVVFSPDGKSTASGGEDGTIRIWDVEI